MLRLCGMGAMRSRRRHESPQSSRFEACRRFLARVGLATGGRLSHSTWAVARAVPPTTKGEAEVAPRCLAAACWRRSGTARSQRRRRLRAQARLRRRRSDPRPLRQGCAPVVLHRRHRHLLGASVGFSFGQGGNPNKDTRVGRLLPHRGDSVIPDTFDRSRCHSWFWPLAPMGDMLKPKCSESIVHFRCVCT